ncbi:hypothetical protein CHS0354_019298 [Potamilus streckersoni]|uniref:Uncharacterized protein n=1 Tax=Potamilus streckersoni TaxID=2493646 RepID=A0AAE0SIF6_9BIVA|nr:hypothetical protein CHS0354_019298 [Potamilus streckersoni]
MARNEEKQFGRLNRLYLEKEKQEFLKKHPPRPKLISLNSAEEIKKWLPSIKTDIDFCLKQSQVVCYPNTKIEEFSLRIESLSREYKFFLRKLKQLDPSVDIVPWTERAYSSKRKRSTKTTSQGDEQISTSKRIKENETKSRELNNINNGQKKSKTEGSFACETLNFIPIHTPILDSEEKYKNCYGYNEILPEVVYNSNPDLMDKPLEFAKQAKMLCKAGFQETFDGSQEDGGIVFQRECSFKPREHNSFSPSDTTQKKDCGSLIACNNDSNQMQTHVNLVSCYGSLNLPYSDSSSDETDTDEN